MGQNDLVSQVERVGNAMEAQTKEIGGKIKNIQRSGTSLWIDTANSNDAIALYTHLRQNGVLTNLNGERGVMTKPALTLEAEQTAPLLNALRKF